MEKTFIPQHSGAVPALDEAITLTIEHSLKGKARHAEGNPRNATISSHGVAGTGEKGYSILQQMRAPNQSGDVTFSASDYQEVVFTFSEPLVDLQFDISDIDELWYGYKTSMGLEVNMFDYVDSVVLESGSDFTASPLYADKVKGSGTDSDPWTTLGPKDSSGAVPNNSDLGNVRVTFTEPVTSFTIRYRNRGDRAANTTTNQAIYVTKFEARRIDVC